MNSGGRQPRLRRPSSVGRRSAWDCQCRERPRADASSASSFQPPDPPASGAEPLAGRGAMRSFRVSTGASCPTGMTVFEAGDPGSIDTKLTSRTVPPGRFCTTATWSARVAVPSSCTMASMTAFGDTDRDRAWRSRPKLSDSEWRLSARMPEARAFRTAEATSSAVAIARARSARLFRPTTKPTNACPRRSAIATESNVHVSEIDCVSNPGELPSPRKRSHEPTLKASRKRTSRTLSWCGYIRARGNRTYVHHLRTRFALTLAHTRG